MIGIVQDVTERKQAETELGLANLTVESASLFVALLKPAKFLLFDSP